LDPGSFDSPVQNVGVLTAGAIAPFAVEDRLPVKMGLDLFRSGKAGSAILTECFGCDFSGAAHVPPDVVSQPALQRKLFFNLPDADPEGLDAVHFAPLGEILEEVTMDTTDDPTRLSYI
jgi:hypothetical protein